MNPAIKLAVTFIVLTAARLGEATGATWGEIDLPGRLWQVPEDRMKASRPHTVPLSPQALEVLERARALNPRSSLIFPLVDPTGKKRQIREAVQRDVPRVQASGTLAALRQDQKLFGNRAFSPPRPQFAKWK